MRRASMSGLHCPSLTPVDETGGVDASLLADHCRWLLDEGCDGLVLFGTTGEATSFTIDERRAALEALIARGIPADKLTVGTGCCAIGDTVALTKHALACGCVRILMLPPFYYKHVSDDGVIEAYERAVEEIADERLRLYLYRIPQMSGVDISPSIVETLIARYPETIAGLKDSSGEWPSMQSLCREFGGTIDVLVGSERFLLAALEVGASGCVTATANANARLLRELLDTRATELQRRATAVRDTFESLPMIAALKELTAERVRDARWRTVKPPLTPLDGAQTAQLLAIAHVFAGD